ncbi:uncharacterized protein BDZ83DRAFT_90396 [Colletotrichum acutatum]|uniref:Uncharacterized protein n=1 Tax=Glomerella acutata TaxID=27357 RepID=A0AAD8X9Z5_GLOAC|nr:uncharacterized protein BDZ83DRAFT_90396 [Colletotrichum acutatum]KAK1713306.1 hypothetical protein BDZ83DRAFT_90396 [Colletotrichum acutatum]
MALSIDVQLSSSTTGVQRSRLANAEETRSQRDVRYTMFRNDHALSVGLGFTSTRPTSQVSSTTAAVTRLNLGYGVSVRSGGAVGQPLNNVPANLRGAGSQFSD